MNKISTISFAMLLVLAIFTTACSSGSAAANEETKPAASTVQEEEAAVPVEIGLVETGDISLVFSYSGTLQPEDKVNIVPGAAGRVESVLVDVGDEVKAGDTLALIEDDTYQAHIKQAEAAVTTAKLSLAKMEIGSRPEEIAAAQAAVELARAALNDVASVSSDERTKAAADLANAEATLRTAQAEYDKIAWAGDVGSTPQAAALQRATIAYERSLANYNLDTNPSDAQLSPLMLQLAQAELNLALKVEPFREVDFATARAGIQQAEAALELAQLQLDETTVTAPFDGIIAELNITEGSRVGQQASIATIISGNLEAEVDVQESLISQVTVGQSASLQVTAYPGQDFPGVVTNVSPEADPQTRTFTVKVKPTDGEELLRSGMYADVSILAQENKNSTLAPRAAVIQNGGEPYAFVVNGDNSVERRTVTTGLFDTNRIEILAGLKPDDVVVTAGQTSLIDGVMVDITNDPRLKE